MSMIFIIGIFQFHCKSKHKQLNEIKPNGTCLTNLMAFFLTYKVLWYFNDFRNFFLIKFISKMNNNSSWGKMSIIWFYPVSVKVNWAHLAEKKSRPRAKMLSYHLGYHGNDLIVLSRILFKTSVLLWTAKSCDII